MAERDVELTVNSRTILGIDPGTGRLGWAVVKKGLRTQDAGLGGNNFMPKTYDLSPKPNVIELVDCGLVETKANTPLPERLGIIYSELDKVIKKYSPEELAIEELFFVKNVKTGISVAHARGVAMLVGVLNKLEIFEYKPNEIKLGICGYGHATKEQISKMIELHIRNCKIEQDDTADAVAVALYHLQTKKFKI